MTYTDIIKHDWIESLPVKIRPFLYLMRLDRPIGTWLLLCPALWSITLAGGSIGLMILFALGALIMRGAGCVINDLWDKELDKKVERTVNRPLASGVITTKQALVFLAGLLSAGLLILTQMNFVTMFLGVIALALVIMYPLMKRVTWWPQAFLGLTFNFGALMGWSASTGAIESPAIWLYLAGFFWTLGYDTIYALQDVEDDALVGIKSTARLFGNQSEKWILGFYMLCTGCLSVAIMQVFNGWIVFLCLPACLVLKYQLTILDPKKPSTCLKAFKLNREFGIILWLMLFLIGLL